MLHKQICRLAHGLRHKCCLAQVAGVRLKEHQQTLARVTLVRARDLAGGQPVSKGRGELCHGGFVNGAGDGIVYEVT